MSKSLKKLRSQFETWVVVTAVTYAFRRLEAQKLGILLDQALDDKFGEAHSEEMQRALIKWLKQISQELESDARLS